MVGLQVSSRAIDVYKYALNNRRDDHMDRWTGMMLSARQQRGVGVESAADAALGDDPGESVARRDVRGVRSVPALAIEASVVPEPITIVRLWCRDHGRSQLVCE